jgi:hypothetical protein
VFVGSGERHTHALHFRLVKSIPNPSSGMNSSHPGLPDSVHESDERLAVRQPLSLKLGNERIQKFNIVRFNVMDDSCSSNVGRVTTFVPEWTSSRTL